MKSPEPLCKGCGVTVRLPAAEIDRLVAEALRAHPMPLAHPDTAEARLSLCRACPDLRYGTTCAHCGCLVEIRARLAPKACPAPTPRWEATA